MPLEHYKLAADPAALVGGLAWLSDLERVGVDVERADWNRYYREAALIQVGGAGRVVVVDPLALDDLTPLHDWLATREVVFHAMENDLEPLASLGVVPLAVADTAVAAALLGLPTGLETLLAELLGVELAVDKAAMQRADWEARPLAANMLAYSAADVADLPALWAELRERLEAADRVDWYVEELDTRRAQPSVEDRREWTRMPGLGRMRPDTLARARALWEAREELARSTNTAPGRIAGDKVLIDLAVRPPAGTSELGRRGMRRQAVRDFGAKLLAAADGATASADGFGLRTRPVTDEDRAAVDRLRGLRAARADELGIDAGVLCPNRTLIGAVVADPTTADELRAALGLRAWQWAQLRESFTEALGIEEARGVWERQRLGRRDSADPQGNEEARGVWERQRLGRRDSADPQGNEEARGIWERQRLGRRDSADPQGNEEARGIWERQRLGRRDSADPQGNEEARGIWERQRLGRRDSADPLDDDGSAPPGTPTANLEEQQDG